MERLKPDSRLSNVIARHVQCYLENTGRSRESYIKDLLFPKLIEAGELVEPDNGSDFCKWRDSQCKRLTRYITGENQISTNWVFPFIASLPVEYQQPLKNELCGMLGSFFVALTAMGPRSQNVETRSHLPQMAKEWGDILIKANPAMDGSFSASDNPIDVLNYANEITECIGILMAELGAIYRGTGIEPAAVKAYRNSTLFS